MNGIKNRSRTRRLAYISTLPKKYVTFLPKGISETQLTKNKHLGLLMDSSIYPFCIEVARCTCHHGAACSSDTFEYTKANEKTDEISNITFEDNVPCSLEISPRGVHVVSVAKDYRNCGKNKGTYGESA